MIFSRRWLVITLVMALTAVVVAVSSAQAAPGYPDPTWIPEPVPTGTRLPSPTPQPSAIPPSVLPTSTRLPSPTPVFSPSPVATMLPGETGIPAPTLFPQPAATPVSVAPTVVPAGPLSTDPFFPTYVTTCIWDVIEGRCLDVQWAQDWSWSVCPICPLPSPVMWAASIVMVGFVGHLAGTLNYALLCAIAFAPFGVVGTYLNLANMGLCGVLMLLRRIRK